jgi:hypothetical protein
MNSNIDLLIKFTAIVNYKSRVTELDEQIEIMLSHLEAVLI